SANVVHRDMEDKIAEQYLEREYDVLMGGGSRHFAPDKREDGKDLHKAFSEDNYTVVHNKQDMANAPNNKRLLSTFSESHMPFLTDQTESEELSTTIPNLALMHEKVLERIAGHSRGFI